MRKLRKYTVEEYQTVLNLRAQGLGYRKIHYLTNINEGVIFSWYSGKNKPRPAWDEQEWKESYAKRFTPELRKKLSEARKGKPKSKEHRAKLRLSKLGSKNPMWKGNRASKDSARNRAQRRYKRPKGKEIHHVDGDPHNNDPENIDFVTRREHMIKDGRMFNRDERGRFTSKKLSVNP